MRRTVGKRNKRWVAAVLCVSLLVTGMPAITANATVGYGTEDLYGDTVWMGWTYYESGNAGYASCGDGGQAYGRYQMDYRYALEGFLDFCLAVDSKKYSMLAPYAALPAGNEGLMGDGGLRDAWVRAYNKDPEQFSSLQDQYMYEQFYLPAKQAMLNHGINLDEIDDPVVKGTIYSLAVRDGANDNGVRAAWQTYNAGDDIQTWLGKIYDAEASRHPGQSNRWSNEQKMSALNGGTTTGTLGNLGTLMASDGTVYQDYVKEWIDAHLDLAWGFVESGGWNESNKTWARTIRQAGDFYELYGIRGGSLDFAGGTSGGRYINDVAVNAELYGIPENGGNNPIPYFTQGSGAPWASVPFGGKNIASSGCSVTSLAMVLSFLKGGINKDEWIYPNDVVAAIASKYGNYNQFYDGSSGQSWGIFPAVAEIYGVGCSQIGSGSIMTSLAAGHPVIMSCKPSEFTSKGHFIVLTGITDDGYVLVNDPNGSHASYSYKKYSVEYLASCGKGWWSFW